MSEPESKEPWVWGHTTQISAAQVRAMNPEVLRLSLLMSIEQVEHKAKEMGVENPDVRVMYLTEFIHFPVDEDEDDEDGEYLI